MAKAASPVRLQADLMAAASTAGGLLHRSAAEQIEHWADLGRRIAGKISPEAIIEITAGLATIKVEQIVAQPIEPEAVFAALDVSRESGVLASQVTDSTVRYQASSTHPGMLERIAANGDVAVGQFNNGVFTPLVK